MKTTPSPTDGAGPSPTGTSQTPASVWRLTPLRVILAAPCILVAAYVLYAEVDLVDVLINKNANLVADWSDEAKSIDRWLNGLVLAAANILVLALGCASFAILRRPGPARRAAPGGGPWGLWSCSLPAASLTIRFCATCSCQPSAADM